MIPQQLFNVQSFTIMKNRLSILVLAAVLGISPALYARLNVVVTTPDLAAIAREIGGAHVEITTLARPAEDPHFVDAKPNFIVKLNKADVIIEGGAELEIGWLPALLDQARNSKLAAGAPGHISCNEGIHLLEVPSTLDRSKGDIHAAGNPHYLIDPLNAKIVAAHLADSFCKLDAAACATYQANLKAFTASIDAKLNGWLQALAPFKGQRIVSYHNSWPYFSERFGVKIDLFMEPKPGIPPTPTHLGEVIQTMKSEKIRVIFVEPFLNRRTAETVARNTGAVVLDVSQFPGGVKNTDGGYVQLLDQLVSSLAKALGGQAR
ncbi:MAG: zinc/manganese transport system substrate-binding protein [Verrucomicrobiota bacterium]|jgi:zinc/manganese transport system substrate-binding protein